MQHATTRCNTLQHAATRCNTRLQQLACLDLSAQILDLVLIAEVRMSNELLAHGIDRTHVDLFAQQSFAHLHMCVP